VLGTGVPKAAIDEDGNLATGKDDVRSYRQLGKAKAMINPKT
jgi:hypothetical protein